MVKIDSLLIERYFIFMSFIQDTAFKKKNIGIMEINIMHDVIMQIKRV